MEDIQTLGKSFIFRFLLKIEEINAFNNNNYYINNNKIL